MSSTAPQFFKNPIRYLRWSAVAKPAYFYSVLIGCTGPVIMVIAPPIRKYFGDERRPPIPMTYPIPKGPRTRPEGFDD
ncbi:hypothetical protein K469DRAFT_674271 [Zopfia rhizophila CBS 207.26]|uniref:NADH-ubiquinone oxidoreductase 9.5 kDa subunit n=1 Tax=Zopfia rhizophila CBS 207.26 TaxID=1314779 RepID=A0A6A6DP54_9PEZI|nr:hypothetical protein K469DRAFT_674271 [Zopfia rhizophila CBS 207.26]